MFGITILIFALLQHKHHYCTAAPRKIARNTDNVNKIVPTKPTTLNIDTLEYDRTSSQHPLTEVLYKLKEPQNTVKYSYESEFTNFLETSDLWVDKSMLIQYILELEKSTAVITCPRKWGKSLNLVMLRDFFDMHPPDQYRRDLIQNFFKYGYLTNTRGDLVKMNRSPLISKNTQILDTYLQKFPVIYLDLKELDANGIDRYASMISDVYKRHSYLVDYWMKNNRTVPKSGTNLQTFRSIRDRTATQDVLIRSIRLLSKWLSEYHNKDTFIFIDDFDSVHKDVLFNTAIQDKNPPKTGTDFMAKLIEETFKDPRQACIRKAVVTGIFKVVEGATFKNLQSVIHDFNLITMRTLSPFYGFSINEVETLMVSRGMDISKEKHRVLSLYDGYKTIHSDQSMMCPWSIIEYLRTSQPEPYWQMTGSTCALPQLLKHDYFHDCIYESAINNNTITITFDQFLIMDQSTYDQIYTMIRSQEYSNTDCEYQNEQKIAATLAGMLALVTQAGYLTSAESTTNTKIPGKIQLKVPNLEVSEILQETLVKQQQIVSKPVTKQLPKQVLVAMHEPNVDPVYLPVISKRRVILQKGLKLLAGIVIGAARKRSDKIMHAVLRICGRRAKMAMVGKCMKYVPVLLRFIVAKQFQ